jgi:hypothetical protein
MKGLEVDYYTADKIKELLQAGESETIEFNQAIRDADQLATSIQVPG